MKAQTRYFEQLESLIQKLKTHDDSIEAAAAVVARALENDGLVHVLVRGTRTCLLRKCSTGPAVLEQSTPFWKKI